MTIAVCINCGEFKHGAFKPCLVCGKTPIAKDELALSLALTDHYYSNIDLESIRKAIKNGERVRLASELKSRLEQLIEKSGYPGNICPAYDAGLFKCAQKQAPMWAELFKFAEVIFEIGHSLADLRERVNEECGTFRSLFYNLFHKVDYQSFAENARALRKCVQDPKWEIEIRVEPSSEAETEFACCLALHVDDLLHAADLTVRKFECMAKKAASARSGPSWEQWKEIIRDEIATLDKCDSSGRALTEHYHLYR